MIKLLDHANNDTALQIYEVFQSAYQIEANLIGVKDFPPLSRSTKDIQNSTTQFYGFKEGTSLAAVVEFTLHNETIEIDSFTVSPNYFRKGIANKLLGYVLSQFDFTQAIVETAAANTPAINLYKKHGFVEFKRWIPSHGIPKLAMRIIKP